MLVQCCFQSIRFHQFRMPLAVFPWLDVMLQTFFIGMNNQVQSQFFPGVFLAELNHLPKLPCRINVHQWERRFGRIKGLAGQMDQNC